MPAKKRLFIVYILYICMIHKIAFNLPCYLIHSERPNMKFKISLPMVDDLQRNLLRDSRKNSSQEILSCLFGIIHVIDYKVEKKSSQMLHIEISIMFECERNPASSSSKINSNTQLLRSLFDMSTTTSKRLELDEMREIISNIIPAAYSIERTIRLSRSPYFFKIRRAPINIKLI